MGKDLKTPDKALRSYPKLEMGEGRNMTASVDAGMSMQELMGMRTYDAAHGVYVSAISALGKPAEKYANFASAIFAETEPQDAIEAMLIAQMAATHVAMTTLCEQMTYKSACDIRETTSGR